MMFIYLFVAQAHKEIASLRDMLYHMINRNQSKDEEDDVPELPPPVLNYHSSSSSSTMAVGDQLPSSPTGRSLKARRKTNTTKELLGSLENLTTVKSEFLN